MVENRAERKIESIYVTPTSRAVRNRSTVVKKLRYAHMQMYICNAFQRYLLLPYLLISASAYSVPFRPARNGDSRYSLIGPSRDGEVERPSIGATSRRQGGTTPPWMQATYAYASRHYICVVERSNPQPFAGGGRSGRGRGGGKGTKANRATRSKEGDQGEGRAMKPKRLAESAERAPHTHPDPVPPSAEQSPTPSPASRDRCHYAGCGDRC